MRTLSTTMLMLAFAGNAHAFCYQSGEMTSCAYTTAAESEIKAEKRTRDGHYFSAHEAHAFLAKTQPNSLFIDIRTRGEYTFVGSPSGLDGHIPYMEIPEAAQWDAKAKRYELIANSHFALALAERLSAKGLTKTSPIVLICRSGDRSAKAADLLSRAGFSAVYTITDGFEGDIDANGRRNINGWRNVGLPWAYPSAQHVAYSQ